MCLLNFFKYSRYVGAYTGIVTNNMGTLSRPFSEVSAVLPTRGYCRENTRVLLRVVFEF